MNEAKSEGGSVGFKMQKGKRMCPFDRAYMIIDEMKDYTTIYASRRIVDDIFNSCTTIDMLTEFGEQVAKAMRLMDGRGTIATNIECPRITLDFYMQYFAWKEKNGGLTEIEQSRKTKIMENIAKKDAIEYNPREGI